MLVKPEFIIFDYGNTLIYENIDHTSDSFKRVYESIVTNPYNLSMEEIYQKFLDIQRELRAKFHKDDIEFRYVDVFKILFAKLSLVSEYNYEKLSEYYFDDYAKESAMEGAKETLEYLRNIDVGTGVISNLSWSEDILANRLKRALDHEFKYVLTTANWVYRKPDKRIFDIGVIKSGVDRSKIWYVGDNPKQDILGAHGAGIVPVYYKSPHDSPFISPSEKVDINIDHLAINKLVEIIELLEEL